MLKKSEVNISSDREMPWGQTSSNRQIFFSSKLPQGFCLLVFFPLQVRFWLICCSIVVPASKYGSKTISETEILK